MRTASGITRISNGDLIDGTGSSPIRDAVVVVDGGRISYAGAAIGAPSLATDVHEIDARGGTIMSGLIESHFHATYFNVLVLEDLDIKYPRGTIEQWIREERRELHAGDVAFIPMDTVHATFVAPDAAEPVRLLVVWDRVTASPVTKPLTHQPRALASLRR